jgi:hypothetical protein
MKVKAICSNNTESDPYITYNLTIGKVYTITIPDWAYGSNQKSNEMKSKYENMVGLKDDKGEEIIVPLELLKLIDEHRNDQIEEILK